MRTQPPANIMTRHNIKAPVWEASVRGVIVPRRARRRHAVSAP